MSNSGPTRAIGTMATASAVERASCLPLRSPATGLPLRSPATGAATQTPRPPSRLRHGAGEEQRRRHEHSVLPGREPQAGDPGAVTCSRWGTGPRAASRGRVDRRPDRQPRVRGVRHLARRRERRGMTGSDVARPAASEPRIPDTIDALVVPLDGSGFSLPARPAATRPAVMLGAEVHLLSAVESVDQVDTRDRELARIEVLGTRRAPHGRGRPRSSRRDPRGGPQTAERRRVHGDPRPGQVRGAGWLGRDQHPLVGGRTPAGLADRGGDDRPAQSVARARRGPTRWSDPS